MRRMLPVLLSAATLGAQDGRQMDPLVALAQLPATPAVADARTSVRLTVVDAAGQPAAGAVLVVLPRGLPPELRGQRDAARERLRDDPLRALAATALLSCTRYQLDADGGTTATVDGPCTVLATTRSECALLDLAPLPPPARLPAAHLVLRPHRRIDVAVACADGTPAVGVLVAASATDNRADPWRWSTGPDGVAHVELPNLGDAFGLGHLHVIAALRSELGSAVADLDADRAQFRLPPCGTVRVTVADDAVTADQQLRFALHCGIGRVPPTEAGARAATFALVEAGATTIAVATIQGTDAELTAPAPIVAAGATAEVRLEAIAPRLRLRVCDATGAPLAQTRVVTLWSSQHASSISTVTTDGGGEVELEVESDFLGQGSLRLEVREGGELGAPALCAADVPLGALAKGRNDGGDVRLVVPPSVLQGRAVDAAGKPVADLRLKSVGRGPTARARTGADGSFELRMLPPHPEQVELGLDTDAWFLAEQPDGKLVFAAGATDAQVVVRRAARLLLGMKGLPADLQMDIDVEAIVDGASVHQRLQATTTQLRVPAGRCDLVFRFADGAEPVHRIDGVVADAGVENHDPRLLDLDWHQFGSVATVLVEEPDGRPCNRGQVSHRVVRKNGSMTFGRHLRNGRAVLFVEKDGGHLSVRVPGEKLEQIDLGRVTGEQRVRLRAAKVLRVRLDGAVALPAGYLLQVMLQGADDAAPVTVAANGLADLPMPAAGTHVLRLLLRHGNSAVTVDGAHGTVVEVADGAAEVTIPVTDAVRERIQAELAPAGGR